MTPEEYKGCLEALGATQAGFARAVGVNDRTGERWALTGPSPPVEFLLHLIMNLGLSWEEVLNTVLVESVAEKLIRRRKDPARKAQRGG
jgi:hypothetical protein